MTFTRSLMIAVAVSGGLAATVGSASAQQMRPQGWVCTNLVFTNQGPRCFAWQQSPYGIIMPPPFYATAPAKKPMVGTPAKKPAVGVPAKKKVIKKQRKRGGR